MVEGYMLKIIDLKMNTTQIVGGPHEMPKVFRTITDLRKYAHKILKPQTFSKPDSRFEVKAIHVKWEEVAEHTVID